MLTAITMAVTAGTLGGAHAHRRRVALDGVRASSSFQGVAQSIDNPARLSFVSEMTGPADLPNAIGLNSALFQVARIIGPAFAGVIIVLVGTGWCFALNAAVVRRRHRRADGDGRRRRCTAAPPVARAKGQIREGLRYIRRDARAAVDPVHDARRGHARDQLPGGAAADRQGHVRRQRGHVQLDDGVDGRRRAHRRARRRAQVEPDRASGGGERLRVRHRDLRRRRSRPRSRCSCSWSRSSAPARSRSSPRASRRCSSRPSRRSAAA